MSAHRSQKGILRPRKILWVLWGVLVLAWIGVALGCEPDPAYTPTPVLGWEHDGQDVAGFRIYADDGAGIVSLALECGWECHDCPDDACETCLTALHLHCSHADLDGEFPGMGYPVQRLGPWELVEVRFGVSAYDAAGNESAVTWFPWTWCMPAIQELR